MAFKELTSRMDLKTSSPTPLSLLPFINQTSPSKVVEQSCVNNVQCSKPTLVLVLKLFQFTLPNLCCVMYRRSLTPRAQVSLCELLLYYYYTIV